jgi:hypothetical protein
MEAIDGQQGMIPTAASVLPDPGGGTSSAISRAQPRQIVFLMLAIGVTATTAMAIWALIFGDFGEGMYKAMGSTAAMFAYGLLALIGSYRFDRRPSPTLARASVVTAMLGLATSVIAIWAGDSENAVKLAWVGFIIAFATAHASFLQARRRPNDHSVVRGLVTLTQGFIALAATMLCVLVIAFEDAGDGFVTVVSIVLLLDVMLNVLVPLVRRAIPGAQHVPEPDMTSASPELPPA